ncbi:unnamed protein product [Plasmodium vivax]|uniref:(malaria parasite P. vivax) hypothetical protein n=1 Tax=Plasmodium vivax TaxID=5855 RepID=A0A8S4H4M6_PLAVI|nr:unnamed protein product [Plasmodium vivax]
MMQKTSRNAFFSNICVFILLIWASRDSNGPTNYDRSLNMEMNLNIDLGIRTNRILNGMSDTEYRRKQTLIRPGLRDILYDDDFYYVDNDNSRMDSSSETLNTYKSYGNSERKRGSSNSLYYDNFYDDHYNENCEEDEVESDHAYYAKRHRKRRNIDKKYNDEDEFDVTESYSYKKKNLDESEDEDNNSYVGALPLARKTYELSKYKPSNRSINSNVIGLIKKLDKNYENNMTNLMMSHVDGTALSKNQSSKVMKMMVKSIFPVIASGGLVIGLLINGFSTPVIIASGALYIAALSYVNRKNIKCVKMLIPFTRNISYKHKNAISY